MKNQSLHLYSAVVYRQASWKYSICPGLQKRKLYLADR